MITNIDGPILSLIIISTVSLLSVGIWFIIWLTSTLKQRSIIKKLERMTKMARSIWLEEDYD
tara:strand:+ start:279 stop:464 length:186 start_codon:yes stop_codon:yes gene_type:complete